MQLKAKIPITCQSWDHDASNSRGKTTNIILRFAKGCRQYVLGYKKVKKNEESFKTQLMIFEACHRVCRYLFGIKLQFKLSNFVSKIWKFASKFCFKTTLVLNKCSSSWWQQTLGKTPNITTKNRGKRRAVDNMLSFLD